MDLPQATLISSATGCAQHRGGTESNCEDSELRCSPALMVELTLKDAATGARILPAYYSENYVSLLPGEEGAVTVEFPAGRSNRPSACAAGTSQRQRLRSNRLGGKILWLDALIERDTAAKLNPCLRQVAQLEKLVPQPAK